MGDGAGTDRPTDDSPTEDALAEGAGRIPAEYAKGIEVRPWVKDYSDPQQEPLLERVVESENMQLAWKQVKRNKGALGVDGQTIEETPALLREHWPEIRFIRETLNPV